MIQAKQYNQKYKKKYNRAVSAALFYSKFPL